ncbi:MAG TPA: hypothetical protein VMU51_38330, partial [Mycobacteriales bacterium]|nr:hypothetical protein [Mycobacteriales bacterium]
MPGLSVPRAAPAVPVEIRPVPTPRGEARAHLSRPAGAARGLLVLGHGAGGGVGAPDLVAIRDAAVPAG